MKHAFHCGAAVFLLAVLLLHAPSTAAQTTTIYLHDTPSDVAGYRAADLALGPSNQTSVTNTVAGGTDIQVTKTAGGAVMQWITPPVLYETVIPTSTSMNCGIYGGESSTLANAALRCRVYKYSGGVETYFGQAYMFSELTTSVANGQVLINGTLGTTLAAGDRLVFKIFLQNCDGTTCPGGVMAGGYTVTVGYDGSTAGVNAATYVSFNQSIDIHYQYCPQPPLIETHLTTDAVTAVGVVCKPMGVIETYLTKDSATGEIGIRTRSVAESLTTSASVGTSKTGSQSVSQTQILSTSAIVTARAVRFVNVAESLTTSATIDIAKCGTMFEQLTTTDSATGTVSKPGAVSENLTTSASVSLGRKVSIQQSTSVSDTVVGGVPNNVSINTSMNLTTLDSIAIGYVQMVNPTELLSTTGTTTALKQTTVPPVSESLATTDAVHISYSLSAKVSESLATTDALNIGRTVRQDWTAGITESILTSDAATVAPTKHLEISANEQVVTLDNVNTASPGNISISVPELTIVSDALRTVAPQHFEIQVAENLITNDNSGRAGYTPTPRFIGITELFTTRDSVSTTVNKRRFVLVDSP